MTTTEHLSKQYDADLESLRSRVLEMGGLVETQIRDAIASLTEVNEELADRVIMADHEVNRYEVGIDDSCGQVIVKRQPAARDLRLIMAISKTVTDLERIGDEAVNIGERAQEASRDPGTRVPTPHLRAMADLTQQMLRDALDAFVHADVERAERVRTGDDAVDDLYGRTLRETMEYMAAHADRIPAAMGVVSVAKYLERIADHATNVAEEVIFMVKGQDVRHADAVASQRRG